MKRAETKWEILLENVFVLEDILENKNAVDFKIRSTFWVERTGDLGDLLDAFSFCFLFLKLLVWLWHVKLKKLL